MKLVPVRIVIIDDEQAVRRRLSDWLTEVSFDVVAFGTGDEGIQHLTESPSQIALIDLRLGESDGTEIIQYLSDHCPQTRLIALCAFPNADQVLRAFRAGAHDLLEKPVQQNALLRAIEMQLAKVGVAFRTESDFNRWLGARLRAERSARERTLADVARNCGLSAAQLSQIELGKTATSTWTLARICSALQVPLTTLLNGQPKA